MIDYSSFLSSAARHMRESAIRKMGTMAAQGRDIVSFAPGYPAPETFPWPELDDLARSLLTGSNGGVLQYGPTRGHRPLVDSIVALMADRDVVTSAERVIVTTGSQQGLDLVARVLLDPHDVILVELPTYTGAISAFRNVQAQMAGVRQDADGIDLDDLDAVYARVERAGRRARLLYVVPNFQNPTGLLVSRGKRVALLEWAVRRDVIIIEDDPYRDLYFDDSVGETDVRAIRADDDDGRVVYLSSFSKTLAPGFRVAWIDAAPALVAKFELAKQAGDLCTGVLDQHIVHEACARGILKARLPILRAHYRHKRDVMSAALRRELGDAVAWTDPRGGFFLWASLPAPVDADALIPRAIERGVLYVAGEAFFVDGGGAPFVRLSFSAPTPERIEEGIARLAAAIGDELTARRQPV